MRSAKVPSRREGNMPLPTSEDRVSRGKMREEGGNLTYTIHSAPFGLDKLFHHRMQQYKHLVEENIRSCTRLDIVSIIHFHPIPP